jgi:hypothetical protein
MHFGPPRLSAGEGATIAIPWAPVTVLRFGKRHRVTEAMLPRSNQAVVDRTALFSPGFR